MSLRKFAGARSQGWIWRWIEFGSIPRVVRGLEYYTGPVLEAELTFEAENEEGQIVRFGSVGGGGRYDGLVSRFKGTKIPATGFSIGVSRLYAALQTLGKLDDRRRFRPGRHPRHGPRAHRATSTRMARTLREAGIRAEMYLGTSGMKAQMKYADKRGAPCVVIQGGDELARGEVTIKDLIEGERLSGRDRRQPGMARRPSGAVLRQGKRAGRGGALGAGAARQGGGLTAADGHRMTAESAAQFEALEEQAAQIMGVFDACRL